MKKRKQKLMNNALYKKLTAKDIAEKLIHCAENKEKLLICAHRNPDGDAVGSAFALKMIYKAMGGEAYCTSSDEIPDYLRFLLRDQESIKFNESIEYDTIVTVDTASPSQMGELSFLCEKVSFAIDHHESATEYSDTYRNKDASAAGEMIFEIYEELINKGIIKEDGDICRLIYSAISSDTGSFKYSNTTEDTHKIAAKLIKAVNNDKNGINTSEIARLIHNSKSIKSLKADKMVIENLRLTKDGKIAYVLLEGEDMDKNGLSEEDFGSAVDIPRSVEEVLLAFVLKDSKKTDENQNKIYRISARSSCDVSVGDICKKFGGGGHAKAAGASVSAENGELAVKAVLSEFNSALMGE